MKEEVIIKMDPVIHFEMPAVDLKRIANFYKTVFGWNIQIMGPAKDHYALVTTTEPDKNGWPLQAGAINGGFFRISDNTAVQHPSVVIQVEDIETSIQKIKELGGQIFEQPHQIPGVGKLAYFRDTEGNTVSMLQPIPDN